LAKVLKGSEPMKIGYRTIALIVLCTVLPSVFVQRVNSVQESLPARILPHPTEPGVSIISWRFEQGKQYEIYWSSGPVSEDMAWTKVADPQITTEEGWMKWTDDGSKTGGLPVGERYYIVLLVANRPPNAPVKVVINETEPKTDTNLTCTLTPAAPPDPDAGDTVKYAYKWKAGTKEVVHPATASLTDTLTADNTAKDEAWTVTATPNDGKADGPSLTSSPVTIKNSPPSASGAAVSPDPAYKSSTLTIVGLVGQDPDKEDTVTYKYQWKRGGIDIPAATDATLSNTKFNKGDSISCRVTPTDGTADGNPIMTQVVAIQNSPPGTPSVIVEASPTSRLDGNADNNSDLICKVTKATPADIDGDSVVYKYEWLRNGAWYATRTKSELSDTISSAATSVGETWLCILTPNDGTVNGTSVSDSIAVMNALPRAVGLSISPASPLTGDDLIAAWNYQDPDGDAEKGDKREVRWHRNAQAVDSLNNKTTVPASETGEGETWYFRIRVHDGKEYSDYAQSPSVVIGNTAPVATNAHIEPPDATSHVDLTATYDFSDVDGDAESGSEIRWYLFGALKAEHNDKKIVPASATTRYDVWRFTVRPKDGSDYGTLKTSPDLTLRNARPQAQNVGLSADPSPATRVSKLTVSYTYFDQDYVPKKDTQPAVDPENVAGRIVEWYKNGTKVFTKNGVGSDTLLLGTEYTDTKKGDTWFAKASVHDGIENGPFAQSPSTTLSNFLPVAQSPYITPASPLTADDLVAHYTYYDADYKAGTPPIDAENTSKREVRWFKDGVVEEAHNDKLSLPASATSRGERWRFTIRVHDDSSYGPVGTSGEVTIGNTVPVILNPALSPSPAVSADDLTANYTFKDDDNDSESGTEYRWYKNGALFTIKVGDPPKDVPYGQKVLTANHTTRGDNWLFSVRASDGTAYSNWGHSPEITVVNAKPRAADVRIEPSPAITTDTLVAKYSWSDRDQPDDTDQGTQIRWFRKKAGEPSFTEVATGGSVSPDLTTKGDQWYIKVKPGDSYELGAEVQSGTISIVNAAPKATVNPILPPDPVKGTSLSCNYTYSDADGDAEKEDATVITWYKDGSVYQTGNRKTANILTVPANVVVKGEVWKFAVIPHDGTTAGSEASTSVTIGNKPPSVENAKVTPTSPKTDDDLQAGYTFKDVDGDSESGTEIRWYKNDVNQPGLNNFTTVNRALTAKGELWYFMVKPNDGTDVGAEVKSASVTIGNTSPAASDLSLTPDAQAGGTVTAAYTWTDPDAGDTESGSKIEWFRKPAGGTTFSKFKEGTSETPGILQVAAGNKGEQWYFTVEPKDGTDFGSKQTSVTVTVGNTAPTASGLTITPLSPKAGQKITAGYSYSDADGDTENGSVMTWYRKPKGGAFGIVASGTTTAGATGGIKEVTATGRDEQWYFTIKPKDGTLFGQEYQSAIITVINSAPQKPEIKLSPDVPASNENILCTVTKYGDADGDTLNFEYYWTNGAGPISRIKSATTDVISGALTNELETWTCQVRASDGLEVSAWSVSDAKKVNAVPQVLTADITADPTPPSTNSTLTATATGADAFGGTLKYDYQWLNNDAPIAGAPNSNKLTKEYFSKGHNISCRITAKDGIEPGNSLTSIVLTIANAVPKASNVSISPAAPRTNDDLVGSYQYSDNDYDPESGTVLKWFVNGLEIPRDKDKHILPKQYTTEGDVVVFSVLPKDGIGFGAEATVQKTILNSPPDALDVYLAPAGKGQTLVASYTYYDADNDPQGATQIKWYKNNVPSLTAVVGERGEQWYFTVSPYDGTEYGPLRISNTMIAPNTPPTLDGVAIGPEPAYVTSTFTATPGTASDVDGDKVTFLFQWQKFAGGNWGDISGATSNTLGGGFKKDEQIRCVVRPHDGMESGSPVPSNAVTVSNSPPNASGLFISPPEPSSTNNLTAIYSYSDADNDAEENSVIKWFKNNVPGPSGKTLPEAETAKGEQWHFTVQPRDKAGTLGTEKTSGKVTIGNAPPTASNVGVLPPSPRVADVLTADYDYADPDNDAEAGTQVQWYKNGSLFRTDTVNAGQLSQIASTNLRAGDRWFFTVRPKDGYDFGMLVSSAEVTIGNSPPAASNVRIEPASPNTTQDLQAKYDYTDADGDPEAGTEIRWYKGGTRQGTLDDLKTVPASATTKGQSWYFTVKPRDGIQFGTQERSPDVYIVNAAPTASVADITGAPWPPVQGSELVCNYTYSDADGDTENGTQFGWWRNRGGSWREYDGVKKIDANVKEDNVYRVLKNDLWEFRVKPKDGVDFGTEVKKSVVIGSLPPSASNLAIDPARPKALEAMTAKYTWSDPDQNDSESGSRMWWYANGVEQAVYRNLLTVPAGRTVAGQQWYFTVEPSDGAVYGPQRTSPTVTINRPPSQPVIALSPAAPRAKTNLRCDVTTASSDADGDAVKYVYRWSSPGDGKVVTHGPKADLFDVLTVTGTPETTLVKGETWTCKVTPTDTTPENGTPAYGFVDIVNTPPVITTALIKPDPAYTNTPLSLERTSSDDDGDPVSFSYQWRKDGINIPGQTAATLPSDKFDKGDSIDCVITPHDGTEAGAAYTTGVRIISNSPPSQPNVNVTPDLPGSDDPLVCTVSGSVDPDGDAIKYEYQWYKNGVPLTPVVKTETTDVIPKSETTSGDRWICTVTPIDSEGARGPYGSDSVTIQ